MKIYFENNIWYVKDEGTVSTFSSFFAKLINSGLPRVTYVISQDPDKSNCFIPMSFVEDPRYPGGGLNSPFTIEIFPSEDGQGTLRFIEIENVELAKELREKLADLGFKNVVFVTPTEPA